MNQVRYEFPSRRFMSVFGTLAPDRRAVLSLIVLFVSMVVATWPAGDFPLNDDWVYALAVKSVLERGHLEIPSFSSANLGPQVYWGALYCLPFGFSFTALRLSTLTLALVGVVGLYFLCKEVWDNRVFAFLAALTLMVNPLYFGLANTFMTDVPFLALMIVSVYLIYRGISRNQSIPLFAGLGCAVVSVTLRQFSLLLLLGFAIAKLVRSGFGTGNIVRSFSPLVLGVAVNSGFGLWLRMTGRKPFASGISNVIPDSVGDLLYAAQHDTVVAFLYLGMFVAPLALACLASLKEKQASRSIYVYGFLGVGGLILFGTLYARNQFMPVGVNVLTYFGLGPLTLKDSLVMETNLPVVTAEVHIAWKILTAVSAVGAVALVMALLVGGYRITASLRSGTSRVRDHWGAVLFVSFGTSYWAVLVLISTHNRLFDRYLLPLLVLSLMALPLIGRAQAGSAVVSGRSGTIGAVCLLAAFALFSMLATRDYLESNRVRWIALEDLLNKSHIDPRRIDGGYEINGWLLYDPRRPIDDPRNVGRVQDAEYILASDVLAGFTIVRRYSYRRLVTGMEDEVVVLHRPNEP